MKSNMERMVALTIRKMIDDCVLLTLVSQPTTVEVGFLSQQKNFHYTRRKFSLLPPAQMKLITL